MLTRKSLPLLFLLVLAFGSVRGEVDPLPSWNPGEAKSKILQFIQETTLEGSPHYIALEERIAVFDQDGTLLIEKPFYSEMFFAVDRIRLLAEEHPEWKERGPFKPLLTDCEVALSHLTIADIEEMVTTTHAGMSVDAFREIVSDWLSTAIHPRFKKPFTELIYQPMLEVLELFASHGFKNYIVSGSGQEFIRAYAKKAYGIPTERIIGSTGKVRYAYQENRPVLIKLPEILFIDDKQGKAENINLFIGRHPVAAFGNSDGDQQMLEWTESNSKRHFELLVHHDDAAREYAYGPDSKIGTFSNALKSEAKKRGWTVVSIKSDWKVVFPFEKSP